MTTCIPWDERGDFVHTAVNDWAEHTGSNPSRVMMDALEWYFTNRSPEWFYNQTVEKIESEEFKRLHRPGSDEFCHRMSCHVCYAKRSAYYAKTNPAIPVKPRGDRAVRKGRG